MERFNKQPRRDLKRLSDEELQEYYKLAEEGTSGKLLASQELARRRARARARRPSISRWWLAVIGIILAAIMLVVVLRRLT